MTDRTKDKPITFNINIDHVIPSVNIFPYDMIYGFADTIREYDSLVLARVNSQPIIFLIEMISSDNKRGRILNNEIAKWIRDVRVWSLPIIRIIEGKMRKEFLRANTPLSINLVQDEVLVDIMNEIKKKICKIENYLRIYMIGVELYNLLYYLTLYLSPKYFDILDPKMYNRSTHDLLGEDTISKYLQCFSIHIKLLKRYKLGFASANDKSNGKPDQLLNKLCSTCYDIVYEDKEYIIREKLYKELKDAEAKKVFIIIFPQLIYPVPGFIKKILFVEKGKCWITYKRIEYMNNAIKSLIDMMEDIGIDYEIYILFYRLFTILKEHSKVYINGILHDLDNLGDKKLYLLVVDKKENIPPKDKLGLDENIEIVCTCETLDELIKLLSNILNGSYPDTIISIILQDYIKGIYRELDKLFYSLIVEGKLKQYIVMSIPEKGFTITKSSSGQKILSTVEVLGFHKDRITNLFYSKDRGLRIYFKLLRGE